jgi:selenocysteine lyase/cysteine desulfurase
MKKDYLSSGSPMNGLSRRDFVKYLVAGSALSASTLTKLNASIYQSITSLNQKYIKDESPDGVYWDSIQQHFLFQDGVIMMNNGTVGPMPKPVFNTLMKTFKVQVTNPFDVYNYIPRKREQVRRGLAEFINASPEEVVMTRNTTEGINFMANGLEMKEGDEVLLSTMEHSGGIYPWRLKEKRFGIKVVEVPIGLPPKSIDEFVGSFEKAITQRTRIISISHTVFISGLISPLKELCRMAHDKEVLVLADGAHAIGMLNLNMKSLGADFYMTSPYKWMGAPCGIGVLYVKKEMQDRIWPTIASSGWDMYTDARKFETLGQRADALMVALGETVNFQNHIGRIRIEKRIKALAGYLKQELKAIPGVKLHTSEDPYISGGLTVFSCKDVDSARIVDYVRHKYNIVVRTIGSKKKGTYGVRVSTPIYVTYRHIDMLLEGIKTLVRHKA